MRSEPEATIVIDIVDSRIGHINPYRRGSRSLCLHMDGLSRLRPWRIALSLSKRGAPARSNLA